MSGLFLQTSFFSLSLAPLEPGRFTLITLFFFIVFVLFRRRFSYSTFSKFHYFLGKKVLHTSLEHD